MFTPPVFQSKVVFAASAPLSLGLLMSDCQVAHWSMLVITAQTFSGLALMLILLLHFTGAFWLMVFMVVRVWSVEQAFIVKPTAIAKIDFEYIVVVVCG